jgi:hypothetical protein
VIPTARIIDQIAEAPALLSELLASVPPADLKRRPQPTKWSAHEHFCHLAVMEPVWPARLERILTEDRPTIVSYEPDDEPEDRLVQMDLQTTLLSFAKTRAEFALRLRQLPLEAWLRPAVHTAHARYSLYLMCRHMALHDGFHAYRIEESALGSHWPEERDRA